MHTSTQLNSSSKLVDFAKSDLQMIDMIENKNQLLAERKFQQELNKINNEPNMKKKKREQFLDQSLVV